MVQKDKEAALRQQEMMEELARKEEERKAYEEVSGFYFEGYTSISTALTANERN